MSIRTGAAGERDRDPANVAKDLADGRARVTEVTRPARDYRLDFFRGVALFFIFIDHIPDNPLAHATLKSVAFADAAEVFIFISGYTAAMVYGRAMVRDGVLLASVRIWRRVWQLYVAHLIIFLVYTAQVAYAISHMTNPLFAENLGVGDFLSRPDITLVRVLLLQFQPTYLDILPLYIALLLTFPATLLLLRRSAVLGLGLSVALYGAAWAWGWNLPAYPEDEGWYFNPFAWQLLFTVAAFLGLRAGQGRPVQLPGWLVALAALFAAFAAIVQISWVLQETGWPVTGLLRRQLWPIDKTGLGLLRLASMLSIAAVVAWLVSPGARFLTSRAGWVLVLCGQNSLDVFCLSILLSVLGGIVLTGISDAWPVVAAINALGMAAMVGLAAGMAWYNGGGRFPPRPVREASA